MHPPSVSALEAEVCDAARRVSGPLATAGHQAWLVGGLVRDLVLGTSPKDVDLATDARPEQVEAIFPGALGVGRAFGTLVIPGGPYEVQVTTFRRDGSYADGRRPEEVTYGTTLEEDALRRDFTCNALYLDPERDRFEDPMGGLADLEAGLLRAVGDPQDRFAEDGLRILRLARFAGRLGLEVEPRTFDAARASLAQLRGVSPERVLQELENMTSRPGTPRALELLSKLGVLAELLPGGDPGSAPALGDAPGLLAVFAAWTLGQPPERVEAWLRERKATRQLTRGVLEVGAASEEFASCGSGAPRSRRIRLVRGEAFPTLVRVLRARGLSQDEEAALSGLEELRSEGEAALHPEPFLSSADLVAAGARPGPLFGTLLREAETLQLDGEHASRADALDWLTARVGAARDS